jgi:hypothetical protein
MSKTIRGTKNNEKQILAVTGVCCYLLTRRFTRLVSCVFNKSMITAPFETKICAMYSRR